MREELFLVVHYHYSRPEVFQPSQRQLEIMPDPCFPDMPKTLHLGASSDEMKSISCRFKHST